MEAIASVLLSGSKSLNQVVILKVTEGTKPRNSLQVDNEGHDGDFTWGKQQMEEQRVTSSHLPRVNCFVSLKTQRCTSLFLFQFFACLVACFLKQSQTYR